MVEKIKEKGEVIQEANDISIGDEILINDRSMYLTVQTRFEHYQDGAVDFFFDLYGNGYNYLFVVFKHSHPSLYTQSNYRIEDVEYADGHRFVTESKSGERVTEIFVNRKSFCSNCETTKLFDSSRDCYYCPICDV